MKDQAHLEDKTPIYIRKILHYLQEKGLLQLSLHLNWHLRHKPIPLLQLLPNH